MSAFHNDIFNRRSSTAFLNDFSSQMKTPGVFAPAAMPRPLFCETGSSRPSSRSSHFAYVRGCSICEDYVCRGAEICHHEHTCQSNGYSARAEESVTDSVFANGRVRARSATTTVGDMSFGFANVDAEMKRMAADNRWRTPAYDDFYGKPFSSACQPPPPHGHVRMTQDNVDQVFAHQHHLVHAQRQAQMHAEAQAHFSGHCHARQQQEEEDDEVKVTTTTTTTTTTKIVPCETVHCHTPSPPPCEPVRCHTPKPLPAVVVHPSCGDHAIPVGTKPPVVVKPAEPCCTWCKFLPCLSCPKPSNPNARFRKQNFRLFPEYEFLADTQAVLKSSAYFPEHTHVASRSDFRVTVPKISGIAQRVYVDFIGDQMVVMGEHGKPAPNALARSSTRSSSLRSYASLGEKQLPVGVSRVFCKNFFVPRDTYDRDRAQVFIKPNGMLKIVVPALEP
ncbi:hypothetical protein GGI20_002627 [Coemansia sp. BCRC 34301]|nr:hypothetical protein GGI20_002627 [Coemansia sp. BCRC 34301]